MLHRWSYRTVLTSALLVALVTCAHGQVSPVPDWMPTVETHAWCRFGAQAWKEVRVRTFAVRKNGEELRSSTIARTRVTKIGLRSFSLRVSSTLEVGGDESPSAPQLVSREVAPQIRSSRVSGEQDVTIDGQTYTAQVIHFTTTAGSQQETNTIYFCRTTTPQMLKRVTTTVDEANPELVTETTNTVTRLNTMADILGEPKCTWSSTTVIKMRDKTLTICEVNCAEVPGELVSQTTEEHDADGVLVARKELELVGYGYGRPRRFRHR